MSDQSKRDRGRWPRGVSGNPKGRAPKLMAATTIAEVVAATASTLWSCASEKIAEAEQLTK